MCVNATLIIDKYDIISQFYSVCAAACVTLSSHALTAAVSQIDLDAWFRAYKLLNEAQNFDT